MKYFFITGASKGLGKAFAEALLDQNTILFLISRRPDSEIREKALIKNCRIHQISFDLSETHQIEKLMHNLTDHIDRQNCDGVYLINNAGTTGPVKTIHRSSHDEIQHIVSVNYLAPVLLTAAFIRNLANLNAEKSVLNLTSGAAHIPHHGMSMYSSTKAALDMFTRSAALEQDPSAGHVKIHAISPGFVDTRMPNDLLKKSPDEFADVEKFREARDAGKFAPPEKVAAKILHLWFSNKLDHGNITHVNDFEDVQ